MGKDSEHLTDLNPSARAQTIQAYNALVDKMSEVYDALSTNGSVENIECQVRTLYLDVVNLSSKFTTGLYTILVNSKMKVSEKLGMLTILQQWQQETASALERFAISQNKGKGIPRDSSQLTSSVTVPCDPANNGPANTSSESHGPGWMPAEKFLKELRPLLLARKETARRCGETTWFTHLQLIKAAFLAVLETRSVGSTWLQRERDIFEL